MDYSRQPPSAAKGIDMSWPDRRVADALAERVASLPPVMQRADQELARLRQALVQAWEEIAELRVLADHDSLTGLANSSEGGRLGTERVSKGTSRWSP